VLRLRAGPHEVPVVTHDERRDAAVFVAAAAWRYVPSDRWMEEATDRLVGQIERQHRLAAEWEATRPEDEA
jgi:hypothetical protein